MIIYCSYLSQAVIRILEQVFSNSASKRNWKDYKLVNSKAHHQVSVKKVMKFIKVHYGVKIEQADLEPWRGFVL
jgi:hypothetical protein